VDENGKEIPVEVVGDELSEEIKAMAELEKANQLLVDFWKQWLKALDMAKIINKEYFKVRAKLFTNEVCIDMHNIQGKIAIVKAHLQKEEK
jgi:hypothetical protein